jgi:DNA polymerase III delta prime subunit
MTSTLIISQDKETRELNAFDRCNAESIAKVDRMILSTETAEKKEGKKSGLSIGIDQIKQLQKTLYLKPMNGTKKAIIISDAHLLTTEAQNALLKVLEEPPEHTLFLLLAENKETLLPTILSRCLIIEINVPGVVVGTDRTDYEQVIQLLSSITISDALKLAESLSKNKTDNLLWLAKMIFVLREKMIAEVHQSSGQLDRYKNLIVSMQKTYTLLNTTNVNTRFAMENLLLTQLVRPNLPSGQ